MPSKVTLVLRKRKICLCHCNWCQYWNLKKSFVSFVKILRYSEETSSITGLNSPFHFLIGCQICAGFAGPWTKRPPLLPNLSLLQSVPHTAKDYTPHGERLQLAIQLKNISLYRYLSHRTTAVSGCNFFAYDFLYCCPLIDNILMGGFCTLSS